MRYARAMTMQNRVMQNRVMQNRVMRNGVETTSRLGWIVAMMVFVGLLVTLYSIKARTLSAKTRVHALEQTLEHEKQVVQILAAEIAHLESPERLRVLAAEQLGLQPTPVSRTLTLAEAAETLARRPENATVLTAGGIKSGGAQ